MPEVGLPNDVIVICPQTGIIASSFLGLLTGHLRSTCLNRQVIRKCLLSCTKCVICGGVRAERCFHTPPLPAVWIALVTWKGLTPHPAPSSWEHPGPPTYALHHHVLSMRSGCGCPSCSAWPAHWGLFTSPNTRTWPKLFYVLLFIQPTCSECAFVHSSFTVYQDQLYRVSTVSCLACQGMKYPWMFDSAKHFSLFCHFPSTSIPNKQFAWHKKGWS